MEAENAKDVPAERPLTREEALLLALSNLVRSIEECPEFPFEEDPNGPGDFKCPLCYESVRSTKWVNFSPVPSRPLVHDEDCPKALAAAARRAYLGGAHA